MINKNSDGTLDLGKTAAEIMAKKDLVGALEKSFNEHRAYFTSLGIVANKLGGNGQVLYHALIAMCKNIDCDAVPDYGELDKSFIKIFPEGKTLIEKLYAEADQAVTEYMIENRVSEEDARRELTDGMMEGMEIVVKSGEKIGGQLNLMRNIESVIGEVDWDDDGKE